LAGPGLLTFEHFMLESFRNPQSAIRIFLLRLGILTGQQKKDFFAGLDIFALPSRSDAFGLVLLEAWANGVPNIAYRAGGIAEVVRHNEDGLLARCGDVAELAELLSRLIGNAGLRRRLGGAGPRPAGTEFRWEDRLAIVRRTALAHTVK